MRFMEQPITINFKMDLYQGEFLLRAILQGAMLAEIGCPGQLFSARQQIRHFLQELASDLDKQLIEARR